LWILGEEKRGKEGVNEIQEKKEREKNVMFVLVEMNGKTGGNISKRKLAAGGGRQRDCCGKGKTGKGTGNRRKLRGNFPNRGKQKGQTKVLETGEGFRHGARGRFDQEVKGNT